MDLHKAFRNAAEQLAGSQYGTLHKEHGISQVDWDLLTQNEDWTPQQARQIRASLAATVEVALTIAGMPPIPLPVQYVAATIAVVVAPCNRLVAATKAPDTFDAFAASGLNGMSEVQTATREQMLALVMAYSGGFGGEPMPRVDSEVVELVKKESKK